MEKIKKHHATTLNALLFEIAKTGTFPENPEEMARVWLETLTRTVGAQICSFRIWDEEKRELILISSFDTGQKYPAGIEYVPQTGDGIDRKTIEEKTIQIVTDTKKEPLLKYSQFVKKEGILSLISIPLISSNKVIGVITLFFKRKLKPEKEMFDLISVIGSQIGMLIENSRLRKRTKVLSELRRIDELTGLYNHAFFREALERELSTSIRFRYPVCLAMFSIDNFEQYSDTGGLSRGDEALKEIAWMIRKELHPYDLVSRYEKEKFAVIFPHAKNPKIFPLVEKIRKSIERNNKVTVSIGIATCPDNAHTETGLIERAHQALYLAEKEGGNRVSSSLIFSKTSIKFGFCPPILHPFYNFILKGAKDVIRDFHDIELIVRAPEREGEQAQLKATEDLIKNGIDAIAICSKTDSLIKAQIKKANDSGTPVFLFNIVKFPDKMVFGEAVSSIGYDQAEAGKIVGRYLARLLRGRGKVAVLEGLPDALDSLERKFGFTDVLREHPGIEVVASMRADWQREKAKAVAMEILKEYPALDAFFGLSDEMALGAQDALEKTGRKNEIFTIGLDGTQNAFQSIKENSLTATLNTNPVEMGRILMRTVIKSMIKEERIERQIFSPIHMVDLENVDQFLIK